MSDNSVTKRLSAILAADIAGYTRLMEEDSDGTVASWQAARSNIIDPSITEHTGRIVKHTGDGFLAEFNTVQSAVECAVAMQDGLTSSSLEFRMGINLGDIIDDGEDIHGEGVNIAARIEALAEAGGISISGGAFEQVRNRLDCQFEDTGEHHLKNVSAPVKIYRVMIPESVPNSLDGKTSQQLGGEETLQQSKDKARPVKDGYWQGWFLPKTGFRNAGSNRQNGAALVATIVLIALASAAIFTVWLRPFTEDDKLAVSRQLTPMEESENPLAREAVKLGWEFANRTTAASFVAAKEQFERAIKLDPDHAFAHTSLANVYWRALRNGWHFEIDVGYAQAFSLANKHLAKGRQKPSPLGYQIASEIALWQGEHKRAIQAAKQAIELDAADPAGHVALVLALAYKGELDRAKRTLDDLIKASPEQEIALHRYRGFIEFLQRRYEDSIYSLKQAVAYEPNEEWPYRWLIAAYGHLGQRFAATDAIETVDGLRKQIDRSRLTMLEVSTSSLMRQSDKTNLREGWRKAGVSDGRGINTSELVFNRLVFNHEAGGFDVKGAIRIDVILAKALFDQGVLFVDNRYSFKYGHIKGAKHMAKPTSVKLGALAEKNQPIVFYCDGIFCRYSALASGLAVLWGYEKVYYFAGGYPDWKHAKHPITSDSE
jgi:adenylate cyclase